MFKKILVANRGEIAVRVIEAARELGIQTVAIFSEADRDALHVRLADEAYCIGPPPARDSYLKIAAVMSVAEITKADAIHPGYGFLAEDPHFVEVCEESKIVFIGPRYETMVQAGNKLAAKRAVRAVGVPVVPGAESLKSDDDVVKAAAQIGYPLLFKAAAGGGGRGMRIVQNESELLEKFHAARREAEAAFGDSTVYIEKYLPHARHVEVQILGDKYGNIVHWGERECSIQRRYQKLIEESPSPALSDELRHALWEAAVNAAKALDYQNAGTVEFLVSGDEFYFIEINARIQVEHPISEVRVGRNLIKEQIRIAAGEPLGYTQADLRFRGHAIECRINAEDPERNFAPSMGRIRLQMLPGGEGIRLDTALYDGLEITQHYDSLIAKLIAHGPSRQEAIVKMLNALRRWKIEGIKTTRDLYLEILTHPDFVAGEIDTQFLERSFKTRGLP
ncbi:MAG: acetyl-CoA carboxylase biotin carboxylase subunit [Candidatus Bipolaricaulota bacterium]|nr:acetyl-CoA carboxylase biotin carboxylase subunit [Candidatus Bipolaricaulota bacterium]MCS7274681.1 acetyl-CoA carboxylase biotin carboxylase subunit [Candidatus Bipolaricaulota bacterium]MDW8111386.1 acetyl-CoA carboxylase biotin carboxylase subunit [Candidatus Bipolaricaulota bacterium]MDW8329369.1 acetyl-CoA carboxylase biotin carboxylase subunit [Candidatus Bipolaricaulota bacterium]